MRVKSSDPHRYQERADLPTPNLGHPVVEREDGRLSTYADAKEFGLLAPIDFYRIGDKHGRSYGVVDVGGLAKACLVMA